MSKNKLFLAFITVAVAVVIVLVFSRNSGTPVKPDIQTKPQTKPAPVVQTKQAAEPAAKQTTSNIIAGIPSTPKPKLPLTTEQTDLGGLDDEMVDYFSEKANNMLDNPVHSGRAKLQQQMRTETVEETFLHLTDNDNFAMLMPSMGGYPFSPGTYGSDVMMISKMTRVRKLLANAKDDPQGVARFLKEQIRELTPKFAEQRKEFIEKNRGPEPPEGRNSSELPDYMQTSILCTAATYVLSQIEGVDPLPTFVWFYEQTEGKKHLSPVNEKFLFYAMHTSLQKTPPLLYW